MDNRETVKRDGTGVSAGDGIEDGEDNDREAECSHLGPILFDDNVQEEDFNGE